MEQDQYQAEKKIWIDPELIYMPMQVIKNIARPGAHEHIFIAPPPGYDRPTDDASAYGS